MAGEESFMLIYDQDATHAVKEIPVPLWHSPNEHFGSERYSCWGYNYKNSMTSGLAGSWSQGETDSSCLFQGDKQVLKEGRAVLSPWSAEKIVSVRTI